MLSVIPEGILSNRNDSHIRHFILNNCIIKAVIRLPQDAFKMSEGAACTSILYAIKKDPENPELRNQGDIFFARAEHVGITPSGKPISENDLLAIKESYRRFEEDEWDGIEMRQAEDDRMDILRAEPSDEDRLWLEPVVNRTSLLYDRLCYVLRAPKAIDRFSYTYFHPAYYQVVDALKAMPVDAVPLESLCLKGYPVRGRRPSEEALEGIPILKVRNVTGQGIDLDTEFAPDNETIRTECARAVIKKNDVLITCTGEGTIGRVEIYPYDDEAIVDGHITICRLKPGINLEYLVEFLRSESGQIQMLRYVSGSTGQTELLAEPIKSLRVPLPPLPVQNHIVQRMVEARDAVADLNSKADELRREGASRLAVARREMMKRLIVVR